MPNKEDLIHQKSKKIRTRPHFRRNLATNMAKKTLQLRSISAARRLSGREQNRAFAPSKTTYV
jgi:hypothetical protein